LMARRGPASKKRAGRARPGKPTHSYNDRSCCDDADQEAGHAADERYGGYDRAWRPIRTLPKQQTHAFDPQWKSYKVEYRRVGTGFRAGLWCARVGTLLNASAYAEPMAKRRRSGLVPQEEKRRPTLEGRGTRRGPHSIFPSQPRSRRSASVRTPITGKNQNRRCSGRGGAISVRKFARRHKRWGVDRRVRAGGEGK